MPYPIECFDRSNNIYISRWILFKNFLLVTHSLGFTHADFHWIKNLLARATWGSNLGTPTWISTRISVFADVLEIAFSKFSRWSFFKSFLLVTRFLGSTHVDFYWIWNSLARASGGLNPLPEFQRVFLKFWRKFSQNFPDEFSLKLFW